MSGLFIEFRDPLFGIILFFVIVFIIAFFSYWWRKYRYKEDKKQLERFAKEFHVLPTDEELRSLLESEALAHRSLYLLADTYEKSGDYEKAIEIYQKMITKPSEPHAKRETMLLLGATYFKAGFLERAKEVFLEILRLHPRTPKALEHLLVIYEHLQEFDQALEVLEPLEELGASAQKERIYLKTVASVRKTELTVAQKAQRLVAIYREHATLSYLVFSELFKLDSVLAWRELDHSQCRRIADILWKIPKERVDFDIIASNSFLRELYSAKGYVDLAKSSSVFELDVLIKLRCAADATATLQFEYLCGECKQLFPFAFHRCPSCHTIDTLVCEMILSRRSNEKNHSLQ